MTETSNYTTTYYHWIMARGGGDNTVGCPVRSQKLRSPDQLDRTPLVGLPRPLTSYDNPLYTYKMERDRMIVPWINWSSVRFEENWIGFDEDMMQVLHDNDYLLCGVCGEKLSQDKIYGQIFGREHMTSGPGMHPRCALLAWQYCPDLNESQGFTYYNGEGHGLLLGQGRAQLHDGNYDLSEVGIDPAAKKVTIAQIKALAKADKQSGKASCPFGHDQS